MLRWLTEKRMTGGLVFGPAAWVPDRIEDTFDGLDAAADGPGVMPRDRAGLRSLVREIKLTRTSDVMPGIDEQLVEARDRPIRALVLNLLPTQPEFALGAALSRLALEDVVAGLKAIRAGIGARRTLVVMDRYDLRTRRHWRHAMPKPFFTCRSLLNRYPQAHPTILARSLFGLRLAVGALPVQIARVIVDPVTCWAIGRYLRTGLRFLDRPVQLFAESERSPRLVIGRLGESIAAFLRRYRPNDADISTREVIVNGLLIGQEVHPFAARITAATESVTLREPMDIERASPCLACGWCLDVCPTELTPVHLMQLAERVPENGAGGEERALLRSRDARESLHCIGCGLCSYVCPTRLPLMEATLRLRGRVLEAAGGRALPASSDKESEDKEPGEAT